MKILVIYFKLFLICPPNLDLNILLPKDMPRVQVLNFNLYVYEAKDTDVRMSPSYDAVDITALPHIKNLSNLTHSELCDFSDSIMHPPWLMYYDRSPGMPLARNYGYFVGARDLLTSTMHAS